MAKRLRANHGGRVLGKGDKERVVPIGLPAIRAIQNWLATARPELVNSTSGDAVFLGARGKRIDQRTVREVVYDAMESIGSHAACVLLEVGEVIWLPSSNSKQELRAHLALR